MVDLLYVWRHETELLRSKSYINEVTTYDGYWVAYGVIGCVKNMKESIWH